MRGSYPVLQGERRGHVPSVARARYRIRHQGRFPGTCPRQYRCRGQYQRRGRGQTATPFDCGVFLSQLGNTFNDTQPLLPSRPRPLQRHCRPVAAAGAGQAQHGSLATAAEAAQRPRRMRATAWAKTHTVPREARGTIPAEGALRCVSPWAMRGGRGAAAQAS